MRTHTTFPVALLCVAVLAAGCSAEPMSDEELEQLESFGPGLQAMGEGLAETGEALGDAVCTIGRAVAKKEHKRQYARRCPTHAGRKSKR